MDFWAWFKGLFAPPEEDCHIEALRKQASLPAGTDSKMLFIERDNGQRHVWLIYRDRKGDLWCWDRNGSQALYVHDFIDPMLMGRWVENVDPKSAYYG